MDSIQENQAVPQRSSSKNDANETDFGIKSETPSTSANKPNDLPAPILSSSPSNATTIFCLNTHPLQPAATRAAPQSIICDECSIKTIRNLTNPTSWGCRECDYDLCLECYTSKGGSENQLNFNENQIRNERQSRITTTTDIFNNPNSIATNPLERLQRRPSLRFEEEGHFSQARPSSSPRSSSTATSTSATSRASNCIFGLFLCICCPFVCLRNLVVHTYNSRLITPIRNPMVLKQICNNCTKLLLLTLPLVLFVTLLALHFNYIASNTSNPSSPPISTLSLYVVVLPLAIFIFYFIYRSIFILCKRLDPQMFQQEEGLNKTLIRLIMWLICLTFTCFFLFLPVLANGIENNANEITPFTTVNYNGNNGNNGNNATLFSTTTTSTIITTSSNTITTISTTATATPSMAPSLPLSNNWFLIFTPLHLGMVLLITLIGVSVLQGMKVARASGDSGANATVFIFGCIGCCLLSLFFVLMVLIEMKLYDRQSLTWTNMMYPLWILDVVFGIITILIFCTLCNKSNTNDNDNTSPGLWSSFICWCLSFVAIVISEVLAVVLIGSRDVFIEEGSKEAGTDQEMHPTSNSIINGSENFSPSSSSSSLHLRGAANSSSSFPHLIEIDQRKWWYVVLPIIAVFVLVLFCRFVYSLYTCFMNVNAWCAWFHQLKKESKIANNILHQRRIKIDTSTSTAKKRDRSQVDIMNEIQKRTNVILQSIQLKKVNGEEREESEESEEAEDMPDLSNGSDKDSDEDSDVSMSAMEIVQTRLNENKEEKEKEKKEKEMKEDTEIVNAVLDEQVIQENEEDKSLIEMIQVNSTNSERKDDTEEIETKETKEEKEEKKEKEEKDYETSSDDSDTDLNAHLLLSSFSPTSSVLGRGPIAPIALDLNYTLKKKEKIQSEMALLEFDKIMSSITSTISDYRLTHPSPTFNQYLIDHFVELNVLVRENISLRCEARRMEIINVGVYEQKRRGSKGWTKEISESFGTVLKSFYSLKMEPEITWSLE